MGDSPTTDRLAALTERLEQGVLDVYDSDRYKEYLTTMAKFYRYSYGNIMLIHFQCPTATAVAGYGTWKKVFGRQVKAGAKGIQILAPCPTKKGAEFEKIDPTTGEPLTDIKGKPIKESGYTPTKRFTIRHVFDISQTEGRELPTIGVAELEGDVAQYNTLYQRLVDICPCPVFCEVIAGNAKGYFSFVEEKIVLNAGMSQVQTIKTLVHELAHAKLHDPNKIAPEDKKNRNEKEVEAESVAYVVCQHLGIDTSDYSFGYVAGWSRGRKLTELKASLTRIQAAASEIINATSPAPVITEQIEQERTPQKKRSKPKRKTK